jgi:hypothetical protein
MADRSLSYEQKSSRRWDIRHPDSTSNFWTKGLSARVFEIASHANTAEIRKTQEIAGRETE